MAGNGVSRLGSSTARGGAELVGGGGPGWNSERVGVTLSAPRVGGGGRPWGHGVCPWARR